MWRWALVVVLILASGAAGAVVYEHVPRVVTLAVVAAIGIPACFLMEANIERRRRSRAGQ